MADYTATTRGLSKENLGSPGFPRGDWLTRLNANWDILDAFMGSTVLFMTGDKPVASASNRGVMWYVPGGAGVKDSVEISCKDADDNYEWRIIY